MKKKNNKFYKIELPASILERIVKISQKYKMPKEDLTELCDIVADTIIYSFEQGLQKGREEAKKGEQND